MNLSSVISVEANHAQREMSMCFKRDPRDHSLEFSMLFPHFALLAKCEIWDYHGKFVFPVCEQSATSTYCSFGQPITPSQFNKHTPPYVLNGRGENTSTHNMLSTL